MNKTKTSLNEIWKAVKSKKAEMEGTFEHFLLQNQFPTGQLLKLAFSFFLMHPT